MMSYSRHKFPLVFEKVCRDMIEQAVSYKIKRNVAVEMWYYIPYGDENAAYYSTIKGLKKLGIISTVKAEEYKDIARSLEWKLNLRDNIHGNSSLLIIKDRKKLEYLAKHPPSSGADLIKQVMEKFI